MSVCYARVSVIVYTSSKGRLALSQAMCVVELSKRLLDLILLASSYQSWWFRVAFSKAATDAVHFSGYSTIPVISTSQELRTATSTINAYTKHKSARVAEANKKQVRGCGFSYLVLFFSMVLSCCYFQIVQMLISIVVMYTVCWLPTISMLIMTSIASHIYTSMKRVSRIYPSRWGGGHITKHCATN